jgi:hypothetical protein
MTDIEVTLDEQIGGAPVKKDGRWLVTIAKPGKGQQGLYPESTLKTYGPEAFPPGTKSYFTHEMPRDARNQAGKFKDGAFWNEEAGELQGWLTPLSKYADFLEEAAEDVEASMHVNSRKGPDGTVKELMYHRANTVDLVGFGGLEGSGLKFQLEAFIAASTDDGENGKKEENMEITKEMWDGLVATQSAFATKFDTFVSESLADKQGAADADAVEAAVTTRLNEALTAYAGQEEAINAATIPTKQKDAFKARARTGEDVSADLASAVSFVAEALTEFAGAKPNKDGKVVVVEESLTDNFDPNMGSW